MYCRFIKIGNTEVRLMFANKKEAMKQGEEELKIEAQKFIDAIQNGEYKLDDTEIPF